MTADAGAFLVREMAFKPNLFERLVDCFDDHHDASQVIRSWTPAITCFCEAG